MSRRENEEKRWDESQPVKCSTVTYDQRLVPGTSKMITRNVNVGDGCFSFRFHPGGLDINLGHAAQSGPFRRQGQVRANCGRPCVQVLRVPALHLTCPPIGLLYFENCPRERYFLPAVFPPLSGKLLILFSQVSSRRTWFHGSLAHYYLRLVTRRGAFTIDYLVFDYLLSAS